MYLTVKEQATRSVKWSVLGQWVKRFAQMGILLLLARTVSPREYGIIELIILVLTLGQVIQDFGLSKALVQTQIRLESAAYVAFWVNLMLSLVVYGVIIGLAWPLARAYGDPEIAPVMQVAGLQLILIALRSMQTALAQKEFRFRELYWVDMGGSVVLVICTWIFLAAGYRVWAYAYGLLISSSVQTLIVMVLIPWRPSFRFSLFNPEISAFLRFGGFTALESLQGWLLTYGDNLIVSYFLGLEALGTYALAFNIAVFSFSLLLQPLTSISYSAFSSLQSDVIEVRRAFLNILQVSSMILIPMGAGIALLAGPIARLVLADRWLGITPLIQWLAIFPGSISHLLFANPELYRSLGRSDIMPKLLTIALVYSMPVYLAGTQFGLYGFTLARVSVTAVFFPIQVILASRFLKMNIFLYLRNMVSPLLLSIAMTVCGGFILTSFAMANGLLAWIQLGLMILSGMALYLVMYYIFDRQNLVRAVAIFRQLI